SVSPEARRRFFNARLTPFPHLKRPSSIRTHSRKIARARSTMPTSPDREGAPLAMNTPPTVSPQEWQAAREQPLVKEKALTHARDALAAERRRMPWMAVEKAYEFE